jgi:tRNA pseudouridine38-40 synthase
MPLDVEIMKSVAALFVGTHDFSGFAANRAKPVADTVRTIQRANVNRSGACLSFNVEGDGFLYKMVRLMVGSLVRCASGKTGVEEMVDRLNRGKCDAARLVAPAEGLFLIRIRY